MFLISLFIDLIQQIIIYNRFKKEYMYIVLFVMNMRTALHLFLTLYILSYTILLITMY